MSGWLALLGAGLLEIAWAVGLKWSDGLTRFWPTAGTLLAIIASFVLMAVALKSLPFGTAYAVWTGIGAVGTIILGILIYSEPVDPIRILCLTLIVVGMVGLKLNSAGVRSGRAHGEPLARKPRVPSTTPNRLSAIRNGRKW